MHPQKLLLRQYQSPGDVLMLTAAVRDLHRACLGRYLIDVQTSVPELWENNPNVTSFGRAKDVQIIDCKCPSINQSNQFPGHFLEGFIAFLSGRLGECIELSEFRGDIHLSDAEREWPPLLKALVPKEKYWLITAGGKRDFTIKWWDVRRYQQVVDHFKRKITFVQIGGAGHFHPQLRGVIDLRGRTSIRELIQLVFHAAGVLCPVTFLMHLAAAVEPKDGFDNGSRPCVVVAGGREPPRWEAYPTHQFIHTVGALPCCRTGGCWRSRTKPLGDETEHDLPRRLCIDVVGQLPRCMDMITAADVVQRIEWYLHGADLPNIQIEQRADGANRLLPDAQRPSNVKLEVGTARSAMEAAVEGFSPYREEDHNGRGIVMCAGGLTYTACAWVCVHLLRRQGCKLPMELWHIGDLEMPSAVRSLFERLDVECVDVTRVRRRFPTRRMGGWESKAFAVLHSRFREVLFLDADNVPVQNPEALFESKEFRQHGAILWPDLARLNESNPIWELCGIPYQDEPEVESGQMFFDKKRCWNSLSLAAWMNDHSDFFYEYFHGDKETFHLAFRKLDQPYAMPERIPKILKAALLQYDFDGKILFQHRNLAKWSAVMDNPRIPGFRWEKTCLQFLGKLQASPAWQGFVATTPVSRTRNLPAANGVKLRVVAEVFLRAPINGHTGYGLHACQICQDFVSAGVEVGVLPTILQERFAPLPKAVLERIASEDAKREWELILHPPGLKPSDGVRSVYFTMWETTQPHVEAIENLNKAEAIIVPSRWNASCFRAAGVNRPIHVVPLGIKTDVFRYAPLDLTGPCVFGTGGRLADSDPKRKRVDDVISFFQEAFPTEQDVALSIKIFPDCEIPMVTDRRIRIIQSYFSEKEMAMWFRGLTCFVSGARAEGWGLMQHQALATGRPIIAACYGGIAEYFDSSIGYTVPYELVPADGRFAGLGLWSQPDRQAMIAAMRRVYGNRREAVELGRAGALRMRKLSWKNANKELLTVLCDVGMLKAHGGRQIAKT